MSFCVYETQIPHYEYKAYTLQASNKKIENPYIGFYRLRGYTLDDSISVKDTNKWAMDACHHNPHSLFLLEINLKNYQDSSISNTGLQQLEELFKICQNNKKQIILRFIYSWDGTALESEPHSIEFIKKHICQISQVVNKYKNTIYIVQGLFTGNDGEMHHTNYGSEQDMKILADTLNQKIDSSIYLSVRSPVHRRILLQSKSTKSNIRYAKRLGLFNDGMLGSVYDLGTYSDKEYTKYSEKGTRTQEIAYQNKICKYVPNGGEVTLDNSYNDIDNAVSDLSQMHVSYLNDEHDLNVLNKWKNSTYKNQNGYDYIENHLGYRYRIQNSKLEKDILSFKIINTGFSKNYRPFQIKVILKNKEHTKVLKTMTLYSKNYKIQLKNIPKGSYKVYVKMQDLQTKQTIHLANIGYEKSSKILIGILKRK